MKQCDFCMPFWRSLWKVCRYTSHFKANFNLWFLLHSSKNKQGRLLSGLLWKDGQRDVNKLGLGELSPRPESTTRKWNSLRVPLISVQ
jgi:hypothetical protein